MAGQKYPPRDDEGLIAAGEQLDENLGDPTFVGLAVEDADRLNAGVTKAKTDFATHNTSQAKAKTDRQTKDDSMDDLDDLLSELRSRSDKHPNMTDALRTRFGFPIPDRTRTKTPVPDQQPNVKIDTSMALRLEVIFPVKPKGVNFLGIWAKIGGKATGDLKDYVFQAQDRTSPYLMVFEAAQSGEQVHFMCCWMNNAGERGPFRMVSATITSELQEKL